MNDLLVKALNVALEARSWAEYEADKIGDMNDGLSGWCAIASAELHNRLRKVGIPAHIHMAQLDNSCHVFVVVDDHVVDVTASQFHKFKNETVLVKHHRELESHWFYSTRHVFNSAKALRKHQIKENWDKDQIAYG